MVTRFIKAFNIIAFAVGTTCCGAWASEVSHELSKNANVCPTIEPAPGTAWPELHYHQPGRSWCYAVAIGDLMSFATNTKISSIALANFTERGDDSAKDKIKAYLYNDHNFLYRFSFRGQSYQKAFSVAQKSMICEWSILDQLRDSQGVRDIFLDDLFYSLEDLRKRNPEQLRKRLHGLFDSLRSGFAEELFSLAQNQQRPLIDMAVDLSCDKKVSVSGIRLMTQDLTSLSQEQALIKIKNLLVQQKVIGISYSSHLIYQPQYASWQGANHASLIVGQYLDSSDKVCKYIVRSTDEYTCEVADPSIKCKHGFFVIPREQAIEAISDIIWLER